MFEKQTASYKNKLFINKQKKHQPIHKCKFFPSKNP